jgi:hypothetical protein
LAFSNNQTGKVAALQKSINDLKSDVKIMAGSSGYLPEMNGKLRWRIFQN